MVLVILGSRLIIMLRDERRLAVLLGRLARGVGWLILLSLAVGLVYVATAEDLEAVMLRNTVERYTLQFWRGVVGDERFAARPTGSLSGTTTTAEGTPLQGASVVVATVSGHPYSATSDASGRFRLEGVPVGNYLPMAAAPGYAQAPAAGRVATVREGQTSQGVDFRLQPIPPINIAHGEEGLTISEPITSSVEHPEPSVAVRREFTYTNEGLTLTGGLVHEPPEEMGQGPFPILLIVYPGEANRWEGVSIPLASKGYVVVSYFPVKLIDLEGDVDDLRVLLGHVSAGRLSARGDNTKIVLVGGSVSTVYTYLMAREMEGSAVEEQTVATIQYGGLFDFFQYRESWEQGKITIDPGISELEYLLVAFGRPDTRPELYLRLSPRYSLGPGSLAPTLLVHAGSDIIVPSDQSDLARDEFERLKIPHEYLFYPNIEHYLDVTTRDPTQIDMLNKTLAFLETYVR
jgi:hypothetical protein